MSVYGGLREKERAVYSDLYVSLVENVPLRKLLRQTF